MFPASRPAASIWVRASLSDFRHFHALLRAISKAGDSRASCLSLPFVVFCKDLCPQELRLLPKAARLFCTPLHGQAGKSVRLLHERQKLLSSTGCNPHSVHAACKRQKSMSSVLPGTFFQKKKHGQTVHHEPVSYREETKKEASEKRGVFLATKRLLWHNTCNRIGRIFRLCFGSAPARKDLRADL